MVSWLTSPLVLHPPFAWQQGTLTFILSLVLQLALLVRSSLAFSTATGFPGLRNGVWMKVFPETMKPKFLWDGVTLSGSGLRALVHPRSEWRFCNFFFFWVPSPLGWGHPFRVEAAYFVRPRSERKICLGMSLWRHIAVPPPLSNVGTCVLYINHSGNVYWNEIFILKLISIYLPEWFI